MAQKAKANDLIISTKDEKHTVETLHGDLTLWIKPLSWLERQNALTRFVAITTNEQGDIGPKIDFGGYWQFILTTCITRTDPELTPEELLNIRPEVGEKIQAILPSFESLMAGMTGGTTGPLA